MPFVERDGARIHYREEGTGFPVVLHTGGAGDGAMWDGAGYTERLAGFRLDDIRPGPPGGVSLAQIAGIPLAINLDCHLQRHLRIEL
jgi:pimeloyl-ACP methyl ester carboxylesterase